MNKREREAERLFYEKIVEDEKIENEENIFIRFTAKTVMLNREQFTFELSEFSLSDIEGKNIREITLKELLKNNINNFEIDYNNKNISFHEQSLELIEFLYDIVLLKDKKYSNLNENTILIPLVVLDKGVKFIKNSAKNYSLDISYPLESFIYQKENCYIINFKNFFRVVPIGTKYLVVKKADYNIMIYDVGALNLQKIKFLMEKAKKDEAIKLEIGKTVLGKVLAALGKITKVTLDKTVKEKIIVPHHTNLELFIERTHNDEIMITPRFLYNGKRQEKYEGYTILRDLNSENTLLLELEELLSLYGFENISNVFYLSQNEDLIYKFMSKHINYILSQYTVVIADELQETQFRKVSPVIDVFTGENIRIEFAVDGAEKSEIENILKSVSLKKRYHKLGNGGLLHIDSIEFVELEEFLAGIDATKEEIKMGVIIREKMFLPFIKNILKNMYDKKFSEEIQDKTEAKRPRISSAFKMLRPYQRKGAGDLINLKINSLGGVLADEMGLGKTLQVIAFLHTCATDKHNILIVPIYAVRYWEKEFKRYAPILKIRVIDGDIGTRIKNLERTRADEIIITSYDSFLEDYGRYEYVKFDSVIYDEPLLVHEKGRLAKIAEVIKSESCFCLVSGFVLENLMDVHYLFQLIRPGYFGNKERFKAKYINITPEESERKFELYTSLVKPYLLNRKRDRIATDLPDIITQNLFIDLSNDENYRILYINYLQKINKLLLLGNDKKKISLKKVYTLITRLGQICSHVGMVTGDFSIETKKTKALRDILKISKIENKKVVVITQYEKVLDIFYKEYNKDFNCLYINLKRNERKKVKIYENYQENFDNIVLFMCSPTYEDLKNLEFDTLIYYDPPWQEIIMGNVEYEIYTRKILKINMVLKGTIEEKMYNVKRLLKNEIAQELVHFKKDTNTKYPRQKLMELLQL